MKPGRGRGRAGWLTCAAVVLYESSCAQWSLARMVSDGFFVAGVMLVGLGALVWVANFGGFTALGYGWYLLVRKLSASRAKFKGRLTYLEYVQQRKGKNKTPSCIWGTGLICIAAAGAFLYLCWQ